MSSSLDSSIEEFRATNTSAKTRQLSTASQRSARKTDIRHWLLALVDQGFVSGTRFLATILVGRYCGPEELGTYSLAFSLLVLAGCFQEAMITTPYAVFGQRLRARSRTAYAGAVARMHLLAAVASSVIFVALGLVALVRQSPAFATIAFVLAVTLPCSLVAEFVRRFALAELKVQAAALLDAAIA